RANVFVSDAKSGVERLEALDIIEIDISEAYALLGEILGETVSDDIINEVFSRFCLGK
ncbi:MAG: tRNA uridine-5-carboxymethylaminomethyl(34) synthesis GTPase MnmE, partial [Clostridiales bacterium]|nr:tRNA uridine-5-carboxymethylaminomethyl(34) synthesis GTPase MnmE [Clostridiales bacterium]